MINEDIFSSPFTVTGLPDVVGFFIVTANDVTEPTFEGAVCVGVNFEIGGADELIANRAKVFKENFSGFDEEAGVPAVSYSEVSGADLAPSGGGDLGL